MRTTGLVASAAGLGAHGHACWTYDGEDERRAGIVEFLADGPRLGQKLVYVGSGCVEELRRDVGAIEDVEVRSLEAIYGDHAQTDPDRLLEAYTQATEQALADGFTGLRVVAEVTALAENERNWADHVRWEAIADRYMCARPMAALCLYDRGRLDARIVGDLACCHPAAHAPPDLAPFRLFATGAGCALEGDIDFFAVERLLRLLGLTPGGPVDLSRIGFLDHHGALALHRAGVALDGIPAPVRRTCELLEIPL